MRNSQHNLLELIASFSLQRRNMLIVRFHLRCFTSVPQFRSYLQMLTRFLPTPRHKISAEPVPTFIHTRRAVLPHSHRYLSYIVSCSAQHRNTAKQTQHRVKLRRWTTNLLININTCNSLPEITIDIFVVSLQIVRSRQDARWTHFLKQETMRIESRAYECEVMSVGK